MSETNYNVDINVRAKYEQVEGLNKALEATKKKFNDISGGKTNKTLLNAMENAAEPILEAQKQLDIATKAYEKAQNKYRELIVEGASESEAREKSKLSFTSQNLDSVVKTIESSEKINKIVKSTTKEYKKQLELQTDTIKAVIKSQNNRLNVGDMSDYDSKEFSFTTKEEQQAESYDKAREALNKFMLSLNPTKEKLAELGQKLESAKEKFVELAATTQNTRGAEKEIKKITKEMTKLQESTKKSSGWAGKLMGRIRNISIYRAIRSGLKWFTSGINEGLQGLAQYSGDVNSTMSNINNSLNQVRNTLAVSFASVLQALEPVITKLSDMLVDLVNSFNLAMAKMQGKNVYTKAKKAADSYAKSAEKARKLSFDTFEVLSGGSDKTPIKDLFEEGDVNEDATHLSDTLTVLLTTVKNIATVVGDLISRLIDSGVIQNLAIIIGEIVQAIAEVISELVTSGAMQDILDVITEVARIAGVIIKFIAQIISGLSQLGLLKPIIYGLIAAFITYKAVMIAATIATWAMATADLAMKSIATWGVFAAIGAGLVVAAIAATAGISSKVKSDANVGGFENGGIPAKSELFYMNENGVPEALVNTGGSQTNVINIDQLSEGMRRGFVQAVYDTGLISAIREQGATTLVLDKDAIGSTIASSDGFRNEINRRNTGLNLR